MGYIVGQVHCQSLVSLHVQPTFKMKRFLVTAGIKNGVYNKNSCNNFFLAQEQPQYKMIGRKNFIYIYFFVLYT